MERLARVSDPNQHSISLQVPVVRPVIVCWPRCCDSPRLLATIYQIQIQRVDDAEASANVSNKMLPFVAFIFSLSFITIGVQLVCVLLNGVSSMCPPVYHEPLTKYVKLWVVHGPGMLGDASHFKGNCGLNDPGMHHNTCVTAIWLMSGPCIVM